MVVGSEDSIDGPSSEAYIQHWFQEEFLQLFYKDAEFREQVLQCLLEGDNDHGTVQVRKLRRTWFNGPDLEKTQGVKESYEEAGDQYKHGDNIAINSTTKIENKICGDVGAERDAPYPGSSLPLEGQLSDLEEILTGSCVHVRGTQTWKANPLYMFSNSDTNSNDSWQREGSHVEWIDDLENGKMKRLDSWPSLKVVGYNNWTESLRKDPEIQCGLLMKSQGQSFDFTQEYHTTKLQGKTLFNGERSRRAPGESIFGASSPSAVCKQDQNPIRKGNVGVEGETRAPTASITRAAPLCKYTQCNTLQESISLAIPYIVIHDKEEKPPFQSIVLSTRSLDEERIISRGVDSMMGPSDIALVEPPIPKRPSRDRHQEEMTISHKPRKITFDEKEMPSLTTSSHAQRDSVDISTDKETIGASTFCGDKLSEKELISKAKGVSGQSPSVAISEEVVAQRKPQLGSVWGGVPRVVFKPSQDIQWLPPKRNIQFISMNNARLLATQGRQNMKKTEEYPQFKCGRHDQTGVNAGCNAPVMDDEEIIERESTCLDEGTRRRCNTRIQLWASLVWKLFKKTRMIGWESIPRKSDCDQYSYLSWSESPFSSQALNPLEPVVHLNKTPTNNRFYYV